MTHLRLIVQVPIKPIWGEKKKETTVGRNA
jgi:hypothetical protein